MILIQKLDPVEDFKMWYMNNRILRPPLDSNMIVADNFYNTATLFSDGQFQVELVIAKPHSRSPQHRHPNMDAMEVYLGGHLALTVNDEINLSHEMAKERNDGASSMLYESIRIRPEDWHGGSSGRFGGMFLSIQHWQNGVKPTSVVKDVIFLNKEDENIAVSL